MTSAARSPRREQLRQPLRPQSLAERVGLDQNGVCRAAEVLGVMLDGDAELELHEMAARVVVAYQGLKP